MYGDTLGEKVLDWIFTHLMPWLLIIGLGFCLLMICIAPFAVNSAMEKEKQMLEKCSPNPDLFECQLYLAEKGRSATRSAAHNGAVTGGIVGGMIGGSMGRR